MHVLVTVKALALHAGILQGMTAQAYSFVKMVLVLAHPVKMMLTGRALLAAQPKEIVRLLKFATFRGVHA